MRDDAGAILLEVQSGDFTPMDAASRFLNIQFWPLPFHMQDGICSEEDLQGRDPSKNRTEESFLFFRSSLGLPSFKGILAHTHEVVEQQRLS